MNTSWLTWLCVWLFLLFGLPLFAVTDMVWRDALGGLATMSLGAFALSLAADGWRQGRLRLQHTLISYSAQPRLFACIVVALVLLGLAVVCIGIWGALLK